VTFTESARLQKLEFQKDHGGLSPAEAIELERLSALRRPPDPPRTPDPRALRLGAGPRPRMGRPRYQGDHLCVYVHDGVRWGWSTNWK
jgi:hypothetical protein